MSMTIQSSVKDKILATSSETSKVENAPAEMLRDLDQQMEKRADDGKANVVTDALSRKERVKPRRVRAMAMIIQYGVRGMILAAQSEAFKQENGMMRTVVMDEAHASRFRWMIYFVVLADAAESVSDAIRFEYCLASSSGWTKSPVLWAEIGESSLIGPELVQETTDKVVLIKEKLKAARDRQKRVGKVSTRVVMLADASLHVSLDEIEVDKTLRFVEEPVENSDCEVMRLKCSRMVIVKVRFWLEARSLRLQAKLLSVRYLVKVSWNSKCNFELTWVWEDYLKDKYPRLIVWLVKPCIGVTYESVFSILYSLNRHHSCDDIHSCLRLAFPPWRGVTLFNSIKITRVKTIEKTTSLQTEIKNLKTQLKGKLLCVTSNVATPKVFVFEKHAIDVDPLPQPLRNNRSVHNGYLHRLKDTLDTLRETVEEA
ncbi:hypothetical protein Tco_0803273 [Tanacetum coccineum]|uniref:Uncharacterized protein n=1 Tax=Tanacetum coccineum TaxID=301880 RepID=A0ABQ5A232_9ASTR